MSDLFVVSGANIFEEYPKVLDELFNNKNASREKPLALPSDVDYLDCVYYKMLSLQRSLNDSECIQSSVLLYLPYYYIFNFCIICVFVMSCTIQS